MKEINDLSTLQKGLSIVKFSAPWCGSCSHLTPNLLKAIHAQPIDFILAECNIDDNQELAVEFSIRSLPTTVILKDGKEIKRMVGNKVINEIKEFLVI